jgi:hypothetical protein
MSISTAGLLYLDEQSWGRSVMKSHECQLQTPAVQQKASLLIISPAVGSSIGGLLARVDHAPECKIDA